MSQLGHSHRFDAPLLTSGLPQLADIFSVIRHVSKVPKVEVNRTFDHSAEQWR
jgi:hypothetical protein